MYRILLFLGPLLLGAVACTHEEPMPESNEPSAGADAALPELIPSVHVEALADSVRFTLQVTNSASTPAQLEFSSGQSYDFVVRQGTTEVWRWSGDQMFTQALRSETLGAGETLRYQATWHPPADASGDYAVTGVLTVIPNPVEQSARFHLP